MVQLRGLLHSAVAEENEDPRLTAATTRRPRALSQGSRAGAGQPVAPPQTRHGAIADGRYERCPRAIRGRGSFIAGVCAGALQPGVLLATGGRYQEAADRFSAAVRTNPPTSMRGFASPRCCSGGRPDAARPYAQVIAIDPRIAEAGSAMRWRSFSSDGDDAARIDRRRSALSGSQGVFRRARAAAGGTLKRFEGF